MRRFFASIVVASAAVAMLGVTPGAATGGDAGRVKGRMTLDGKPVSGETVTLNPVQGSSTETDATTDGNGRFTFSVPPGRYKINTGMNLAVPQGRDRMKCKFPGYKNFSLSLQPGPNVSTGSGRPTSVNSLESKAFGVKAGKTVTRDVKADCTPDAVLVQPPSAGGGAP